MSCSNNNETIKQKSDSLIINDYDKEHTSESADNLNNKENRKKHTVRNICLILLSIVLVVVLVFIVIANFQNGSEASNIEILEIEDSDVKIANDYLLSKYNKSFQRTFSQWDKKELYNSTASKSLAIEYKDSLENKFTVRFSLEENNEFKKKPSDDYQVLQYCQQLKAEIKSFDTNNIIDSIDIDCPGSSILFNSIEHFISFENNLSFSLFFDVANTGELSDEKAIEYSKKLISKYPFKECSFGYHTFERPNEDHPYSTHHSDTIHVSYRDGQYKIVKF